MTDSTEEDDISKIDFSVIANAVEGGGSMLDHIFRNVRYGTAETRHLLFHEADFILECKVCRNLFRSFPLFVAHKRLYCVEEFGDVNPDRFNLDIPQPNEDIVVVQPRPTTPDAVNPSNCLPEQEKSLQDTQTTTKTVHTLNSTSESSISKPVTGQKDTSLSSEKPSIHSITNKLSRNSGLVSGSNQQSLVQKMVPVKSTDAPVSLQSKQVDLQVSEKPKSVPAKPNATQTSQSVTSVTAETSQDDEGEESTLKQLLTGKFKGKSSAYCFLTNTARKVMAAKDSETPTSTVTMTPITSNSNAMYMTLTRDNPSNNIPSKGTTKTLEVCSEMEVDSPSKESDGANTPNTSPSQQVSPGNNISPGSHQIHMVPKAGKEMDLRPVKSQSTQADQLKELRLAGHCDLSTNTCNLCRLSYTAHKGLVQHMRSKHSGKQWMYPCCLCTKEFKFRWSVARHMESYHGKNKTQIEKLKGRVLSLAYQVNVVGESSKTSSSSASSCSPTSPAKKDSESMKSSVNAEQKNAGTEAEALKLSRCEGCDKAFWKKANYDEHLLQCKFFKGKTNLTDTSKDRGRKLTRQSFPGNQRTVSSSPTRSASNCRSSSSESSRRSLKDSVSEASSTEVRRSRRCTRLPDRYTRSPSTEKEGTVVKRINSVTGKTEVVQKPTKKHTDQSEDVKSTEHSPPKPAVTQGSSGTKTTDTPIQPMRTRFFDKRRESKVEKSPIKTPPKNCSNDQDASCLSERASQIKKNVIEDMIEEKLSEARSFGKDTSRNSNEERNSCNGNDQKQKQCNTTEAKKKSVVKSESVSGQSKEQGKVQRGTTSRAAKLDSQPEPTTQQRVHGPSSESDVSQATKSEKRSATSNDDLMEDTEDDRRDKLQVLDELKNKLMGIAEDYVSEATKEERHLGIKIKTDSVAFKCTSRGENNAAKASKSNEQDNSEISGGGKGAAMKTTSSKEMIEVSSEAQDIFKDTYKQEAPQAKHPASVSGKVITSPEGFLPKKSSSTTASHKQEVGTSADNVGKVTGVSPDKGERSVEVIWCDKKPGKPMTEVAACKTVIADEGRVTTYKSKTQSRMYVVDYYPTTHIAYSKLKLLDRSRIDQLIDPDTFTCAQCNITYSNLSNARRHAVRHLGWQRFKCKLCRFSSYNKSECTTHLYRIHNTKVRSQSVSVDQFITDLQKEGSKLRSKKKQETLKMRQNTENLEPRTITTRCRKSIDSTVTSQAKNETTPSRKSRQDTKIKQSPSSAEAEDASKSQSLERRFRKRKRSNSEDSANNPHTEDKKQTEDQVEANSRPVLKRSQSLDGTYSKLNETLSDSFDMPSVSDYEMSDSEPVGSPQAKMAPNLNTMMAALEEAKAHVFVRQRGKGRRNSMPPRKLPRLSTDNAAPTASQGKDQDEKDVELGEMDDTDNKVHVNSEVKPSSLSSESDPSIASVDTTATPGDIETNPNGQDTSSQKPDNAQTDKVASLPDAVETEVVSSKHEAAVPKSCPTSIKASPASGKSPSSFMSIISTRSKAMESSKAETPAEPLVKESLKSMETRTRLKAKKD